MDYKEWLAKLVSFDTTSRNSNLELIHFCKDYLEGLGVRCTLVYNAEKTKANLWATLPGEGGVTEGGIILSGHTDVVPVDGQRWDTDPFKLCEKDGKLYGRGATDMKGFIAVAMSLTPEFLRMKRVKPIHYAWSYDEEVGCLGGKVLVEFLRDNGIKADGCIVGEPTEMRVSTGHKGVCLSYVRVIGKAVHSSYALTTQGCNAIDYAAKMIVKLREVAEEMRERGPRDNDYNVPFTTMSTNLIKGGNAVNTIPAECEFSFEFRNVASMDAMAIKARVQAIFNEDILPLMRAEFPEAKIEADFVGPVPSFDASENNFMTKLSRRLLNYRDILKKAGCTESGYFQGIGIPTVVVGPGTHLTAHRANEYVEIEYMDRCQTFLVQVAETLSHSSAHL